MLRGAVEVTGGMGRGGGAELKAKTDSPPAMNFHEEHEELMGWLKQSDWSKPSWPKLKGS